MYVTVNLAEKTYMISKNYSKIHKNLHVTYEIMKNIHILIKYNQNLINLNSVTKYMKKEYKFQYNYSRNIQIF